jgi:hypothetical protein
MRSASSIHRGGPREPEHRCPAPSNRGTRRAGARRCKLPATRMTARGRRLIADGLVRSTRTRGHALSTLTHTRRDLALLTRSTPDAVRSWTPRCRTCASTTGGSATNPGLACSWPLGCWRAPTGRSHGVVAARLPRPAGPRSAPTHHKRPPMATLAHTTPIDRRALSAERAPTPARPCPGTKRHGCDGRRTRARHGRGGVPSGDSDTGPAQARRPWRTGAARRVGFQSGPSV